MAFCAIRRECYIHPFQFYAFFSSNICIFKKFVIINLNLPFIKRVLDISRYYLNIIDFVIIIF